MPKIVIGANKAMILALEKNWHFRYKENSFLNCMKELVLLILIISAVVTTSEVFGHKPISSDGTNTNFQNSLEIPDHKISWAIYEQIEPYQTKFYKFEAQEGDSFYTSIVIPKLERFENFIPGLALISEEIKISSIHNINSELPPGGIIIYNYDGDVPSKEFFEPFTQTTYWERQEVRITIPSDGVYYIAVFDSQGVFGKYSLAVGTIEDFSMIDFFTILPAAWFQTKYFFEDYSSILMSIAIIMFIPTLVSFRKIRTRQKIEIKN